MFSLRVFIMTGLKNAVGKMEDYQIILNATGWYEKNVLLEEDLAELQELIDKKNNPVVEEIVEENTDNFTENSTENFTETEENETPVETPETEVE